MTHEDEGQPGENDRLFEQTEAEKKQAEVCLEHGYPKCCVSSLSQAFLKVSFK